MAYPNTETAGEHLRNALQLAQDLEQEVRAGFIADDVGATLRAIDARITAALTAIGEPLP